MDNKENSIFIEILEKYSFILKRPTDNFSRNKHQNARIAMTREFNERCHTDLSVKQILRKVNNFKFRLREKHYQGLRRNGKPRFSTLEQKFLDLWDANGIECRKKSKPESGVGFNGNRRESISQDSRQFSEADYSSDPVNETNIEQNNLLHEIKSEKDFDTMAVKSTDAIKVETSSSADPNNWQFEMDPEMEARLYEHYSDDEAYGHMSVDELKREALISQIKMFKATEAAARAKEKLKLYKLSILQQGNGNACQ